MAEAPQGAGGTVRDDAEGNALRLLYMPVDEIVRAPRNPKDHDVGFLRRVMRRWGYTDPMLWDERVGCIVAGHGRLDTLNAAQAEGIDPPEYIQVRDGRWMVPVLRGFASRDDDDQRAFVISHNRAGELGGWDTSALRDDLEHLQGMDDLDDTGFDDDDLNYFKRQQDDPASFLDGMGGAADDAGDGGGEEDGETEERVGDDYFALSYAVSREQRDVVHAAIRAAKKATGAGNSVDALVEVCRAYGAGEVAEADEEPVVDEEPEYG